MEKKEDKPIEEYEYLLHHIEVDEQGNEVIHHCMVYDHIANMFMQEHLIIIDGKVYFKNKVIKNGIFHVIEGLEPTQEVSWSDEDAKNGDIEPKKMIEGMTLKQKAKEW